MQYKSNRTFRLWSYGAGHSTLILRSPNNEVEEAMGYNIDIEFWGVSHLDLGEIYKGITIKILNESIPSRFEKYKGKNGHKIFEILTQGNRYYVVAAGCVVGKNNWYSENRIIDPVLEYNEILASSLP